MHNQVDQYTEAASGTQTLADLEAPPATDSKEKDALEAPPRDITGWKWVLASIAILSSIFLYALDATIVAAIQPIIVTEYNALEKLAWISIGFLLAATATNMIWGRIYTQFNSKWLYIGNVFLFEVGSAICGAAPSMNVMIVGRAICGVSGAGLYVGVMTLIAVTTTMAERPLYISATGVTWGLGIVLGPVIGGAFSQSAAGWRWSFYINLVIGGVCAPAWLVLLPSKDPRPGVPYKQRFAEMDYLGAGLMTAGLTTFVLAINWGGVTYPWNSGPIIGTFIASGILFTLLSIQQVRTILTTPTKRFLPIHLFRSKTILILFSCTAASGAAAFVPIYFLPLFFQFTRADSALDAGVRLLPLIITMVVIILANGALMAKFGYYMPWYLAGGLLTAAGSALMLTVDQRTATANIYGYTVLIGCGVGMYLQASFSVAQAVVRPEDVPPSVGFLTLAQFLGITVALAVANCVFLNQSAAGVAEVLPDMEAGDVRAAIEGAASSFVKSLSPEVQSRVLGAIVDAISRCYALVVAAGALVAVLSLLLKREKLFMRAGVAVA
jgi:MFS family permease